jgi:hypothetical protein
MRVFGKEMGFGSDVIEVVVSAAYWESRWK